jgi:hypothetical protein
MSNTDLEAIKKTLVGISQGDTILDTLLEFERTLDNAEVFAYKHWLLGELVEGPDIGRYFYKTVWMYPYSKMPDPNGGLRLTKLGAKVNFRKGVFKRPVKVEGPEDWADPETKQAKMKESKVWLVTINLPLKYINRGLENINNIIQKNIDQTNAELESAYSEDAGIPEDMAQPQQGEMSADQGMPDEGQV